MKSYKALKSYESQLIKEAALSEMASTSMGRDGEPPTDRSKVFDPALKHFAIATVPEDPVFETAEEGQRWQLLRKAAMSHVLRVIAGSTASEHLVLRGSALMCVWFEQAARMPKDLDFVVIPQTQSMDESQSVAMLNNIVKSVTETPCAGIEFSADEVGRNHIWTYDRVPGTRIVFRWTAEGVPWGSTQLDFVFGEPLPERPEHLEVKLDGGQASRVLVASQSLSLAWKLLWLHSDMYPRAKDLYDAMLLAEETKLPYSLLEEVFKFVEDEAPSPDCLVDFNTEGLEWIGFEERETSIVTEWTARLKRALLQHDMAE